MQKAPACSVEGCDREVHSRGLCGGHYQRLFHWGEIRPEVPLKYRPPKPCSVAGCERAARAHLLCATHLRRWRLSGDPGPASLLRGLNGQGSLRRDGYRRFKEPGGKERLEHHVVMERMLGRPLLATERVHHRNGVRHDNRPENLELWTTSHPSGQRVEDIVPWAIEMLTLYAPERLR